MILTYKFRLKDSTSRKRLCRLAGKVNFVWNYVNELNQKAFANFKHGITKGFLSAFDINKLLAGSYKELGLLAQSIQHIAETYVSSRRAFKKPYLSWRSRKRSLGWIPFKSAAIKLQGDQVLFQGKAYRFWQDRSLPEDAKIKCGSFNQDSQGRWYLNLTFETASQAAHSSPHSEIGIDLGIKEAITLSNGTAFQRPGLTKKYEVQLAAAQRAKKKKQARKIHTKIKNSRKDYYHKLTTQIAKQFAHLFVGDVNSQNIIDKEIKSLTKGTYDAAWYLIKTLLAYKAIKLGGTYNEVAENYTTQDCSACLMRCGPKGIEGLAIREWVCQHCKTPHQRDVNAARNILRIGHNTLYAAQAA